MLASRLRTTRAVAGGLALASLLCWVPGSQAAVHTGSATDAADDLSLFAGDELPDPPTNFTNVAVKYDDAAGRVDVAYTFDQVPSAGQEIHAGVGLGNHPGRRQLQRAVLHQLGLARTRAARVGANLSWRATRRTSSAT